MKSGSDVENICETMFLFFTANFLTNEIGVIDAKGDKLAIKLLISFFAMALPISKTALTFTIVAISSATMPPRDDPPTISPSIIPFSSIILSAISR